jgi:hypothetical protein
VTAMTKSPPAATGKNAPPPPRPYPFPVGVYESTTQDYDQTVALGATIAAWTAPILLALWNISPTGWLRTLWLNFVVTVAGNSATPALTADGPWAFIGKCTIYDLGGEVVIQVTGYEWMLLNKFGGYYEIGDPRADITYAVTSGSGGAAGSFNMTLALPFEAVARDALGTVQNESKPGWKIEVTTGTAANVYGTTPTSTGTASLRARGYAESYTEPLASAPNGRPFAQSPPLPGSLQYWKSESNALPSGNAKFDISNGVGFPIRNILYYVRDASDTTRATADANWPDPSTLQLGNVNLFTKSKALWLSRLGKDFGLTSTTADAALGRESGVFPVYFTRDFGLKPGAEVRHKYLDTQVNTLLRFNGSNGGALTMFALTNWLATPSKNRYALIAGGQ